MVIRLSRQQCYWYFRLEWCFVYPDSNFTGILGFSGASSIETAIFVMFCLIDLHLLQKISCIEQVKMTRWKHIYSLLWPQILLNNIIPVLAFVEIDSPKPYCRTQKFEDTNWVIRSRKSKKDRQCNGNGRNRKDKGTNNDLQNITQKTKDRTP